jgi:ferredoxin-NADP reductase
MLALRVCSVRRATPSTRVVRLDLGDARFGYRAGQAARLGPEGSDVLAPYSIASAPEDSVKGRFLEFLIKVDGDERWGEKFSPLRRGMRLAVKGPFGRFTFPDHPSDSRFLFIAGGTGIAPMRSMIRHARARGHRGRMSVLYSARTALDFAYRGELRGMARRGDLQLMLTATRGPDNRWRGERGRITVTQLEVLLEDPATLCFVCGPATMVDDVPRMLGQLGVEKSRIRIEDW